VKRAEIKLATLFASNNVALHIIDEMEPILKDAFPNSKICPGIQMKRTKCTEIVKNVLCKKETSDLINLIRTNWLSVHTCR
jgi:hypothetical protein